MAVDSAHKQFLEREEAFLLHVERALHELWERQRHANRDELPELHRLHENLVRLSVDRATVRAKEMPKTPAHSATPLQQRVRARAEEVRRLLRRQFRFLTVAQQAYTDILEGAGIGVGARGRYGPVGGYEPLHQPSLVQAQG